MPNDIRAFLTAKRGPFPVWVYAVGAFGVTYWYLSRSKIKGAQTAGSSPASNAQFSSSQSTKYIDPRTGAEINAEYQATGSGYGGVYGTPAQFVTAAGPMPYSSGDIYINVPGQTTAPAQPPPPPPPRDPDWGHWATVKPGDTLQSLVQQTLGDANLWTKVWTDPVNKILFDARGGDPRNLKPGDVVWIFYGWKPGWVAPADFVPYPLVKAPPPEPFNNNSGQWVSSPTGSSTYLNNGVGTANAQQTYNLAPAGG